jgi:uncharacterized OB-fold protein
MTDGWEPRPTPDPTPETAPYWEGAADGRLLLRRCRDCDLTYYYPRARCPDCLGDDVEWVEAAGTGEVYAHTATEHVSDWPEAALPLVLAYVELDEGPRMLATLLECDPSDVGVGTRVEATFVETSAEDVSVPAFEPVE